MRGRAALLAALSIASSAYAQAGLSVPKSVVAGKPFTITTTGSGPATLYLVGPGGASKFAVQLGHPLNIAEGDVYAAGQYTATLVGGGNDSVLFDVVPAAQPETLSFLARPSRLPVGLHNGISGTAYLFDQYSNLVLEPTQVTFQLSVPSAAVQSRSVTSRNGVAWTAMDSAPKQGSARFVAQVGNVTSARIIQEVPGDPCGISMSAKPDGKRVSLETAPLRDCSGNAVPDGTIVTFTQTYEGMQTTVDAPLKQGVAKATMPAHPGARIAVASGVVAGNEIRVGGGK